MSAAKDRAQRRLRQSAEIEASQVELRKSIAETERLVDDADKMLKRHHQECEEADAAELSRQK